MLSAAVMESIAVLMDTLVKQMGNVPSKSKSEDSRGKQALALYGGVLLLMQNKTTSCNFVFCVRHFVTCEGLGVVEKQRYTSLTLDLDY